MKRAMLLITLVILCAGTTGQARADGIPGTMNFRNVTGTNVVQTTGETSNNEKHIDFGDFDEDGDLDAVIAVAYSDFGNRRNKLYENIDGVMTEVTGSGAIPGFGITKVSRVAFFRDFDMDGHLDIWIINDSNYQNGTGNDQLFIASWIGGEFVQFVEENNRIPGSALTGAACSGWSADFNQDGFMDVYCGNYPNSAQDRLYTNSHGNGVFANITNTHVVASNDYVVDVNGADLNGDGKLDLLISQFGTHQNRIYYNDLNDAGSGVGDFSYTGSQQSLGNPLANENSMDTADFDGDGDLDIYWTQQTGSNGDRILRNNGNDAGGKATFSILNILPPSVTNTVSRKVDVADFNNDGRIDAFVARETGAGRPTILRNVTVSNIMQFVDWTPANAFPVGNMHTGWQAAIFDTDGDGDVDIFLGGWVGEHLFENIGINGMPESRIGGVLPPFYNQSPIAIVGGTSAGASDVFVTSENISSSSFISVVLSGPDDYHLQVIRTSDQVVVANSNRGGIGVEEALQVAITTTGTYDIVVNGMDCAFNIIGDCGISTEDLLELFANWGPVKPGNPSDLDGSGDVSTQDLLDLFAHWGSSDYILEILSRTGP
ncbi:MAG: VCBS repeat-containing protein [Planctomycetes bacterium]|nr:VCBS repeat-containing protein [Planctomycetota bacterium]